jgi:hypothetical protein
MNPLRITGSPLAMRRTTGSTLSPDGFRTLAALGFIKKCIFYDKSRCKFHRSGSQVGG